MKGCKFSNFEFSKSGLILKFFWSANKNYLSLRIYNPDESSEFRLSYLTIAVT